MNNIVARANVHRLGLFLLLANDYQEQMMMSAGATKDLEEEI